MALVNVNFIGVAELDRASALDPEGARAKLATQLGVTREKKVSA